MKHQTGMTGWPSGNILDFRARLPERNGAKRPPPLKAGVRGFSPGKILKSEIAVGEFWCISDEIMNSYNSFVLGAENIK